MGEQHAETVSVAQSRPGVALTEDLIRRKAEHNEGMLSTLEEIALHQLDIDKIEVLNNCRYLQIVYLQNNLISKIEGLNRLKRLEYINLALNNIERIEGLSRCESLNKLDFTVNFIDLDELHTVGSLKENSLLREVYLTGNPCTSNWEGGYRPYVIATLPQLERLDGTQITRSERIKAMQRLPELERELAQLASVASVRKADASRRRAAREADREAGRLEDEDQDEWCPETRVKDAREVREANEKQEAARNKSQRGSCFEFGQQPVRERRFFRDDGTPLLMNTAKWPFSVDDDGTSIKVDVALPKFLDSAQIEVDIQPMYFRLSIKKNVLQLVLPDEVLTDASTATRSSTTGHLLLTCPKIHPIVTSKAPERRKQAKPALQDANQQGGALLAPGESLAGSVDIRHIVKRTDDNAADDENIKASASLGEEWSDEEEVPPLL